MVARASARRRARQDPRQGANSPYARKMEAAGRRAVSFNAEHLPSTGTAATSSHRTRSPAKSNFRAGSRRRQAGRDDEDVMETDQLGEDTTSESELADSLDDMQEPRDAQLLVDDHLTTATVNLDDSKSVFSASLEQTAEAGSDDNGKDETLVRGIEELKKMLSTFAERVPLIPENTSGYMRRFLETADQELVRYIGCIAMGGPKGEDGWDELLCGINSRKAIVMGVVAQALKEHVFQDYLLGSDDAFRKRLETIDTSGSARDGFERTRQRAALVENYHLREEKLAQDVIGLGAQVAKMLAAMWTGVDAAGRRTWKLSADDVTLLTDIVHHAAKLAHLIRLAPDVVYYWAPTFKDEEFEPASMEAQNLAWMIRNSPYDKVTDTNGFERAVLRKDQANTEAIVRAVVFPALVAYRQYGGSLAAEEMQAEKASNRRLPADVRDRYGQPITPKRGLRSRLICKSVVYLQWGKQLALTKEAGTSAHLDAVRDGTMERYEEDSRSHVELFDVYQEMHPGGRAL